MKILHKLLFGMALSVGLTCGVVFYAALVSQRSLREAIESTSVAHANSVMGEIARALRNRVAQWKAYSRSSMVQQALRQSNREFDNLEDIQQFIDDRDRAWRSAAKGAITPFMADLMRTELSRDMRSRLDRSAEEHDYAIFSENFVANRHGANVAQSNRTSDFRQDDELWWQFARRDGVFVGDV